MPAHMGKLAWVSRGTAVAWAAFVYRASEEAELDIYRFQTAGDTEAYRSFEEQVIMKKKEGLNAHTPGLSNHGTSSAIDFNFMNDQNVFTQSEAIFAAKIIECRRIPIRKSKLQIISFISLYISSLFRKYILFLFFIISINCWDILLSSGY